MTLTVQSPIQAGGPTTLFLFSDKFRLDLIRLD